MRWNFLTLAALLVACGTNPAGPDGGTGTDAGTTDSGTYAGGTDAGGTDAGPADSGSTDAGPSDGGCPYLYCEDFESYSPGAVTNNERLGPWLATVNGVAVQAHIDSVNPKSGNQSFHIWVGEDAGTARATLNQKATAEVVPGNDLYGRAELFYVTGACDGGTCGLPLGVHSWVFNAQGALDGGQSTMNMGGGGAKLQLNYHPPQGSEQSVVSGTMTAGVWHCVQWQYDGSGTPPADTANVWIDGTLAVNVPVTKGWFFPEAWNSFDFGLTHYQVLANPVEIFLDDFALDAQMVPCPP
jgi:hypothetical protein